MQAPRSTGPGPADTEDAHASQRACDPCRFRKIRCDKDRPTCSNCRTTGRICTTGASARREPRQRVLITPQYERKIDKIETRLGSIESLLQKLLTTQHAEACSSLSACSACHPKHNLTTQTVSSGAPTASSTAEQEYSGGGDDDDRDDDEGSVLGGDSGLTEQTAFVSEFLERAVQKTSLRELDPRMRMALANLKQLAEMQKKRSISHGPRFPLQRSVPPGGMSTLPMPPLETVVTLLRQTRDAPPSLFTLTTTLFGISDFADRCRLVYFPTEEFSEATFVTVNAGLYNLFFEQQEMTSVPALRDEYGSYTRLCRVNLETSLANMPLFLSPKVENVQALLLGTLYSIDVSRPSVAWHLICAAAGLCLTGGYHRVECLAADHPAVAQVKTVLFWHVYSLEKGLGLRLGRASGIQECDITIPRKFDFQGFEAFEKLGGGNFATTWIEISYIQSLTYQHLYSPAARSGPRSDVVEWARELAAQCQNLEAKWEEYRAGTFSSLKTLGSSQLVDMFLRGDEVQFHATMTLIYRVLPAPEGRASRFCDECLAYARKAVAIHNGFMDMLDIGDYALSTYLHWNLLLTPFAPFFVLFCHVIETCSLPDLGTIQSFVKSLQRAQGSSETIGKLHRLCQVICDIATLYVEAKSQQQDDQTMAPIGDEFEMYLGQLGMIPTQDMGMADAPSGAGATQGIGQDNQIADWFMLLEQDLPQMENYTWMHGNPE